jgi:hypothetical protein
MPPLTVDAAASGRSTAQVAKEKSSAIPTVVAAAAAAADEDELDEEGTDTGKPATNGAHDHKLTNYESQSR